MMKISGVPAPWRTEVAELCINHLRGCKPDAEHREKATKDSRHSWIRTKMKMEMRVRKRMRTV